MRAKRRARFIARCVFYIHANISRCIKFKSCFSSSRLFALAQSAFFPRRSRNPRERRGGREREKYLCRINTYTHREDVYRRWRSKNEDVAPRKTPPIRSYYFSRVDSAFINGLRHWNINESSSDAARKQTAWRLTIINTCFPRQNILSMFFFYRLPCSICTIIWIPTFICLI